jgi:hypothetical protein
MNARFGIDLLHPGALGHTWREWFVSPQGARRLGLLGAAGVGVLLLILVAGILPTHWRRSGDLAALPGLGRDLQAREQDLMLLRSHLRALGDEARQQIRWGDVLTALSREIPPAVHLALIEASRPTPPPAPAGAPRGAPARAERVLRLDAVTPLREGSAPLLDLARFMAGLMRDPAVARRFALRSWEVKPPTAPRAAGDEIQRLTATVTFAERMP